MWGVREESGQLQGLSLTERMELLFNELGKLQEEQGGVFRGGGQGVGT